MARLAFTVYLTRDDEVHEFGPDSTDLPDWAIEAIKNPNAWEDAPTDPAEETSEPVVTEPTAPPTDTPPVEPPSDQTPATPPAKAAKQ